MKTSTKYIVILVSFVLASIFLACLIDTLTFENDDFTRGTKNEDFIQMTDTAENLVWFIQISDIHLSIYQDPNRITDFREFCDYTIGAIKPEVVLASGDLTHGAGTKGLESGQYREEWEHYQSILDATRVQNKTKWLDIRGNHDMFNVMDSESNQNLFRRYSVQGKTHPKSYAYDVRKGRNRYKFLALDAGDSPGLRRNLNFIGAINPGDLSDIRRLLEFENDTDGARKHTIWFGHFPTSCVLSVGEKQENIREIIGGNTDSLAYLCGHLHTVYGWVPDMYTMQKSGFLELEVGDWKDNRMFRVLAIDHGLLSFVDLVHRDWPVILVTNPKDSNFLNPSRENIDNIRNSTHVRILVFSMSPIKSVRIKIDGNSWIECGNVEGPLYVSKWNPGKYSQGSHSIRVKAVDFDGRSKEIVQSFNLGQASYDFGLKARFALMIDGPKVFFYMLLFLVVISSGPLMVLRRIPEYKIHKRSWNFLDLWMKKLWVLSKIDKFYYAMVLYPIYTLVGPWCVGFLIEDYFGVLFSWGVFINHRFMPGSFTYYYAHLFLVKFHLPFLLILAYVVDYKNGREKSGLISFLGYLISNLIFIYLIYKRLLLSLAYYQGYGWIVCLSGPLWTWSIILVIYLWAQANFRSVFILPPAIKIKAKL